MSERSTEQIRELLDSLYRVDSGRILATLIRLLGDFDLAEEAMHEAFAAALSLWPRGGVPGNPRPWLISTARFKAIDTLRRRARFDAAQDELVRHLEAQWSSAEKSNEEDSLEDDRLRLIFTCCHPSLAPEAHVALTLREVCGLTTEEIAKAIGDEYAGGTGSIEFDVREDGFDPAGADTLLSRRVSTGMPSAESAMHRRSSFRIPANRNCAQHQRRSRY